MDAFQSAGTTAVLWALYAVGWLIVLWSTFLIDHFDLFGLKQAWLHFQGRRYEPPRFCVLGLYRYQHRVPRITPTKPIARQ